MSIGNETEANIARESDYILVEGKKYLTPPELAKRWNWSVNTIHSWRQKGLGPAHTKLGFKYVIYPMDEIMAYEKANPHIVRQN